MHRTLTVPRSGVSSRVPATIQRAFLESPVSHTAIQEVEQLAVFDNMPGI